MCNDARIGIRWLSQAQTGKPDFDCVVGREIKMDPRVLQDFSATILKPVEQDLILLSGAVAYADRVVRRRRGSGWARNLEIIIPVSNPALWKDQSISSSLIDTLEYVTGDHWHFRFIPGARPLTIPQSSLDFTLGNYVVVPFSDGLDSYLQWQLLKVEESVVNVLRIHTSSRASNPDRNKKIDALGGKLEQCLSLPVSFSAQDHPEPSYRSRTFLFYAIAALAAAKVSATRVTIGENGVGSVGPSMIPDGDECPHRTTHPAFTTRFALFINRLLGSKIVFEHPQRYRTKGQVLRRAIERGVTGWEITRSCTRGRRDRLSGYACGVCGGCLLRRTAVRAAGLQDEAYFWGNLSGRSLDECRTVAGGRNYTDNDKDIAIHSIHDMNAFAELAALNPSDTVFQKAAWELTGYSTKGLKDAAANVAQLAQTHAAEWVAFRCQYAADGFLNHNQEKVENNGQA
jgi:7-cyano-7-deazaguanine synthase in queuosine biosynthesis